MGRKHAQHHEEHADETWLVPYADLLTLLLALFIVLFAMGKTDEKKLGQMGRSFHIAFGGGGTTMFPFDHLAPRLVPGENPTTTSNVERPNVFEVTPSSPSANPAAVQAALRETVQLIQLKEAVDRYIKLHGMVGQIEAQTTEDGVRLRIKDSALFESGQAALKPESQTLAADIAKLLVGLPQQIVVAGHTDTVPINTFLYPSNWELSSARALNFMRFMLNREPELKPQNFSAIGYGEFRPIAVNTTEEGRSKNRRVEVWILRALKQ